MHKIEFVIEIPNEWAKEHITITLGELLTNLATLNVVADKSLRFRKVMALGYQNLDLCYEKSI